MIEKLDMLWVNLAVSADESAAPEVLDEYFTVQICGASSRVGSALDAGWVDVVCFNFDYPDRAGLRLVREVKDTYASVPMIMLTLQHSEELAVWAFRSRLADYLVKPVPRDEVERCHGVLLEISRARRDQVKREMTRPSSKVPAEAAIVPRSNDRTFMPAVYYVAQNFRNKISSEDVAKLCAMSPFRFSRAFKEAFGMPFRDYVVRYRLREACRLLENPHATVTDVAFAVGFNDLAYFSRMFKRHLGVSPSERLSDEPDVAEDESPTAQLRIPRELIGDRGALN